MTSQLFLKIPPKSQSGSLKVDLDPIHNPERSNSISTVTSTQQQDQPQPHRAKHLQQATRQYQQQQLSLSTRIDDNSTLYELVDDLLKVVGENKALKAEVWALANGISGPTLETHQDELDVVPSAFRYRDKYEQVDTHNTEPGTVGQLKREIERLQKLLDDRLKYNQELKDAIDSYEEQLRQIMDMLAQRHVEHNRQVLEGIKKDTDDLSLCKSQMYSKWTEYASEQDSVKELYDPLSKATEYITNLDISDAGE